MVRSCQMARSESHVEQFTDTADLDDLHESMDWGFTGEVQSGEEQRRIFNFSVKSTFQLRRRVEPGVDFLGLMAIMAWAVKWLARSRIWIRTFITIKVVLAFKRRIIAHRHESTRQRNAVLDHMLHFWCTCDGRQQQHFRKGLQQSTIFPDRARRFAHNLAEGATPDSVKYQVIWQLYWVLRGQASRAMRAHRDQLRRFRQRHAVVASRHFDALGTSQYEELPRLNAEIFVHELKAPKFSFAPNRPVTYAELQRLARATTQGPSGSRRAASFVYAFLQSPLCTNPKWLMKSDQMCWPLIPPCSWRVATPNAPADPPAPSDTAVPGGGRGSPDDGRGSPDDAPQSPGLRLHLHTLASLAVKAQHMRLHRASSLSALPAAPHWLAVEPPTPHFGRSLSFDPSRLDDLRDMPAARPLSPLKLAPLKFPLRRVSDSPTSARAGDPPGACQAVPADSPPGKPHAHASPRQGGSPKAPSGTRSPTRARGPGRGGFRALSSLKTEPHVDPCGPLNWSMQSLPGPADLGFPHSNASSRSSSRSVSPNPRVRAPSDVILGVPGPKTASEPPARAIRDPPQRGPRPPAAPHPRPLLDPGPPEQPRVPVRQGRQGPAGRDTGPAGGPCRPPHGAEAASGV